MNIVFSQAEYIIKQQGLSIGGKYKLFGAQDNQPLLYIEQKIKWLPPSTTIRAYADEKKTQEVLTLTDSEDTDADKDIIDAASGKKIGTIGMSADDLAEFIKDAWEIRDANKQLVCKMLEKSVGRSVLREALDNELPQQLDIMAGETIIGELRQKVKMAGYELNVNFSMDTGRILDRRLGIAAAIYAAYHQGAEG